MADDDYQIISLGNINNFILHAYAPITNELTPEMMEKLENVDNTNFTEEGK